MMHIISYLYISLSILSDKYIIISSKCQSESLKRPSLPKPGHEDGPLGGLFGASVGGHHQTHGLDEVQTFPQGDAEVGRAEGILQETCRKPTWRLTWRLTMYDLVLFTIVYREANLDC